MTAETAVSEVSGYFTSLFVSGVRFQRGARRMQHPNQPFVHRFHRRFDCDHRRRLNSSCDDQKLRWGDAERSMTFYSGCL